MKWDAKSKEPGTLLASAEGCYWVSFGEFWLPVNNPAESAVMMKEGDIIATPMEHCAGDYELGTKVVTTDARIVPSVLVCAGTKRWRLGNTYFRICRGCILPSEPEGVEGVRDPSKNCYEYALIQYRGLRRVARTCAEGKTKYGINNWRKGGDAFTMDSILNHAISHIYAYREAIARGEQPTEDDLAHAAWNLLTAIHYEEVNAGTEEPDYVIEAYERNIKGN